MTDHEFLTNLPILNKKLQKEVEDNLIFRAWFQNVDFDAYQAANGQIKYHQKLAGTGAVHVMKDALAANSDHALMAMEMELSQDPKFGDQDLEGTGESLVNKYARIYVNLISGVANTKQGIMDKVRNDRMLDHYKRALPALRRWFAKTLNAQMISALYEGHSYNVTTGVASSPNGIGVVAKYHPNMYYNGIDPSALTGEITAIGTEGYNKTDQNIYDNVYTGYSNLKLISPYFLNELSDLCEARKIARIVKHEGADLYLTVMNREELNTLWQNSEFRAAVRYAFSGKGYKNPEFMPESYIYGDHFLMLDRHLPRAYNTTRRDFVGVNGWREIGQEGANNKFNRSIFVIGDGALGMEVDPDNDLQFEPEAYNFKQQQEIAGFIINGSSRKEYVSKDDEAAYFATNQSSKTFCAAKEVTNQSSLQVIVKARKA